MKPDIRLHAMIRTYILLLEIEGLFLYRRNKVFFFFPSLVVNVKNYFNPFSCLIFKSIAF